MSAKIQGDLAVGRHGVGVAKAIDEDEGDVIGTFFKTSTRRLMHFLSQNKKTGMDVWFWIHSYIVFRGLWEILWETVADIAGTSPERIVYVKMRLPTLTSVFKYVHRLRVHNFRRRKHWSFPRLVVEGTYFPPEAHVKPFFTVEGDPLPQDRARMVEILQKYPGFAVFQTRVPSVTWMRIVALKVHYAYHQVVMDAKRICFTKGAFLVLTITNDPLVQPCVTMIGLHDDAIKDDIDVVLGKIPNLLRHSF